MAPTERRRRRIRPSADRPALPDAPDTGAPADGSLPLPGTADERSGPDHPAGSAMTAEVFDPEPAPDPAAGPEDGTDQATEPPRPVPGPPGVRPRPGDGPAAEALTAAGDAATAPTPADLPSPAPTPADLATTALTPAAPATTAARQARSGPDGRAGRQNGRPVPGRPTSGPPARPVSGAGTAGDDRETERGLRGLVGSGSSQVSVGAAMRARDANRPTEADLREAEERLVIVRRNWQPREDLPRNR